MSILTAQKSCAIHHFVSVGYGNTVVPSIVSLCSITNNVFLPSRMVLIVNIKSFVTTKGHCVDAPREEIESPLSYPFPWPFSFTIHRLLRFPLALQQCGIRCRGSIAGVLRKSIEEKRIEER